MEHPEPSEYSFELAPRTVYVWSIPTLASTDVFLRLQQTLSSDEKERAARFRFEHLRHSFVVDRGALRALLGGYLGISPARVQFSYNGKGKPRLHAPASLDFNISHSDDLAVFAFTVGCEIGVDIERIRAVPEMQLIASHHFCPEEAAELMTLGESRRDHAFFLCWTRKEAYIRAVGDGLSVPLNSFRVTIQPGQPARFIYVPCGTSAWALHDLQLAGNHTAALAYRDKERAVVVVPRVYSEELLNITRIYKL
jgi:4'-phosphopantetheinyl transferase